MDDVATPIARQLSRNAVMQTLLTRGPTSRADLAKLTGLSKQTMSDVVRDLEGDGWLHPLGRTKGRPGRSAVVYEINGRAGLGAAIDLGGTKLSVAICDLMGSLVAESLVPTDPRGGADVIAQIAAQVTALSAGLGISSLSLRLAVLGTPGVFHPETTHIEFAPNIPGFDKIDVPALLAQSLGGVPVVIENDVNLAVGGEQWRGHGVGRRNFVFVALGTGVGMGIVAEGQLLRGARGAAGEIGYLPIGGDPYDPRNFKLGTLESAVGSVAIANRYVGFGGAPDTSVRDIFAALAEGDESARATIEETARLLAPALAAVGAMLDPEVVILGGSIGTRAEFADAVRRCLARCSPNPPAVASSVLGSRAALVGAVGTAVKQMHEQLFGVAAYPPQDAAKVPGNRAAAPT